MINTFTFSQYMGIIIGAILQSVIIVTESIIGIKPELKIQTDGSSPKFPNGFQILLASFTKSAVVIFGFIEFDVGIGWILGQWGYSDWKFQLPAALLNCFIGIKVMFDAILKKPTKFDLIFTAITIISMTLMIHVFITAIGDVMIGFIITMAFTSILQVGYIIAEMINGKIKKKRQLVWNFSDKYHKIFGQTVNVILWTLIAAELLLKFMGTSLFIW